MFLLGELAQDSLIYNKNECSKKVAKAHYFCPSLSYWGKRVELSKKKEGSKKGEEVTILQSF